MEFNLPVYDSWMIGAILGNIKLLMKKSSEKISSKILKFYGKIFGFFVN